MVDLTPLVGVPALIYTEISSFVTTNVTVIAAAFALGVVLALSRYVWRSLRAKM